MAWMLSRADVSPWLRYVTHLKKEQAMNEQFSNAPPPDGPESKTGLKEKVRETTETLKAKTKEVVSEAKQRGEEYVEQGKERAAQRIQGAGETFRQSAERFESEHDPNIGHY